MCNTPETLAAQLSKILQELSLQLEQTVEDRICVRLYYFIYPMAALKKPHRVV